MKPFYRTRWIAIGLFAAGLNVLTESTMAQSSEAEPPVLFDTPKQTPIDGGLGLLMAAGGTYALSKLRRKRTTDPFDESPIEKVKKKP